MADSTMVRLHSVWACLAWFLAVLLTTCGTVAGFLVDDHYAPVLALFANGLLASAAAAVLSIRCMLDDHRKEVVNAFDLGRDLAGGNVRPGRFRT